MGYGLPMIGTSIMSAAIIWFIATLIVCYKTWGRIRIKGMRPHAKRIVKKQLKYSLQIYASALIGLAYDPVTKVLISNFFGVTLVGVFDIALRIKRQIYSLMQQGLWPLFQLFSELKDKEKIRLLVHDLEQKIFYFVVPFFVVLLFITKPIITIWIGENIEVTSLSVICITGIYLLFSITVHPNYFFLTSRRPMKIVFIQLSNVFINLIVILATFKFLGYNAVMLSYFAAIFVAFLWGLHFQKKYLDSRIFDSFSQIIKLSATFLVLLGVGYVMDNLLNNNILKIVVQPITIGFLTLLIYRTVNLVNMEDIDRYFTRDGKLKKLAIALFIK
jgi:O-antigen/teichoic acid export membrane protein